MVENLSKTVVVAMSGGVDSSVAALLLNQQGYRVIGVSMKLWDYDLVGGTVYHESGCCSLDSFLDARMVCSTIGLPHYILNFSDQFHEEVVENFIDEYLSGRTPNPCVRCNARIKWKTLFDKAEEMGADYLATGHYARTVFNQETGRYELRRALDQHKDQSYALWGLDQKSLARTLFPLGEWTKYRVRDLAKEYKLPTAEKKESQEICFIPDDNYHRLLQERQKKISPGEMVDTEGNIIGSHQGYPFYTIGQRRGLGGGFKEPMYVVDIDAVQNRLTVGDKDALYAREILVDQVNLVSLAEIGQPVKAMIKIRYNDTFHPGTIIPADGQEIRILMDEPVRSVTPGQSAVFYSGDTLLGGGLIKMKIK
jgi:tRNA-specific 2-thiouridylase